MEVDGRLDYQELYAGEVEALVEMLAELSGQPDIYLIKGI